MKITPWSEECGALVGDAQLANIDESEMEGLRSALATYGVLFFRNQELTPSDHLAFANGFGEIVLNKFFAPVEGYPDIAEVRKEPDQTMNIGGGWHTDHSYDEEPALGSILVARELPQSGGDTLFANLHKAWVALPSSTKRKIKDLKALHSNVHIYGRDGYYAGTDMGKMLKGADDVGQAIHPVVISHPVSGREILYVNPAHTISIDGWSEEDSKALLDELYDHVVQPEFTCTFDWEPSSVAIWDNRLTWHYANNDYDGERRLMHRITLSGAPLAAAA
ncbi:TauD/TfdA dioxygenase family protein [Sphingorhabdus sp.]|uniref:TauD/TfdA dioxygenase family protein n=1 Tax=Sphingorhabdus sp. TaxID=1902408 RepID=UPI004048E628